MSLAFARALDEFLRSHDVPTRWRRGAETRGNGQTSAYRGCSIHHTATASSNTSPNVLDAGRPDLGGPLCNSSGLEDGTLEFIAVNPANHAGASGGWDTAPLPVTGLFNRLMWGHETVYPGVKPMSSEQYRTAVVLGAGVCRLLGHDYDPTWIKFHQGTSITGKWDPGYAPGRTYSIADYRAAVLTVMRGHHAMPLTPADAQLVADTLLNTVLGTRDENDNLSGKASVAMQLARVSGIPGRVLWSPIPNYGRRKPDGSPDDRASTSLGLSIGHDDNRTDAVVHAVQEVADPELLADHLAGPLAAALTARGTVGLTAADVRAAVVDVLLHGAAES